MSVASYSLLLIHPSPDRLDRVVAGAVIRKGDKWDVRVASSPLKMRGINPEFDERRLKQMPGLVALVGDDCGDLSELSHQVQLLGLDLQVDPFVGVFVFEDEAGYELQVSAVLEESVNPPALLRETPVAVGRPRNVVRRKLREMFRKDGILSRDAEDIDRHKVVERFPISAAHGLVAEFALKNGVMHITETIDFNVQVLQPKRVEAQAKSLVLAEAAKAFGHGTKRYVVAAGTSNVLIRPSLQLLADHADLFEADSGDDMRRYSDLISRAAAAG